jgi:cytochrome P450
MAAVVHDDMLTPELVADPYPYFHQLRREDPVHWNERYRAWVVTAYDDVVRLFRDPAISSDRISPYLERLDDAERAAMDPVFGVLSRWLVFQDPPDHTRLRRLVSKAFTIRAVEARRESIESVIGGLLDDLGADDEIDLIADFAYPLPAIVIAQMLGVPPTDRNLFKEWSDDISALVFGAVDDADRHERAQAGMVQLSDYLGELIARYRDSPGDNLISALVQAEEEGDSLSREEVVATCILLLFGGHETTTNLIANGLLALLRNPDQLEALRRDSALLASTVEEVLRYDGPAKVSMRVAARDIDVRDRRVREGDRVFLVPAAANRDPARFPDPDRFDVGRNDKGHVGFGFGIHFCLGAPLARLEGELGLGRLLARFPEMQLAGDDPRWHPTLLSRGMEALPVRPGAPRVT